MESAALTIPERNAVEVRFSGFGGQGVVLAGYIAGKAAAIFEGRHATLTRSFGPESRGGACAAAVVICDERVDYPFPRAQDVLVALSQAAYLQHVGKMRPGGILIYEEDLVHPEPPPEGVRMCPIPATRLAGELGRKMVLNIVVLGFFAAVTKAVDPEALRKALLASVPKGTEELNLKAFETGYAYGGKGGEGR
ncbi:MAG: 2-oxoacid:acceptor oxidoreductase family protein [Planctomycetes bacterium]|nr:2-oxoacid:acceptor oxidoreductase family protein [Planctomycetota bacterium]